MKQPRGEKGAEREETEKKAKRQRRKQRNREESKETEKKAKKQRRKQRNREESKETEKRARQAAPLQDGRAHPPNIRHGLGASSTGGGVKFVKASSKSSRVRTRFTSDPASDSRINACKPASLTTALMFAPE